MHFIDWAIVGVLLATIIGAAVYTKKYTESVSDFLAANRCVRRYLLCISGGMARLGADDDSGILDNGAGWMG